MSRDAETILREAWEESAMWQDTYRDQQWPESKAKRDSKRLQAVLDTARKVVTEAGIDDGGQDWAPAARLAQALEKLNDK